VRLVNALVRPLDNAVAAARTCYSPRLVTPDEVGRDERSRLARDRIAREVYDAGHHTVLQHATFQFTLENVSRQLVWSFLHAHPFYNSEQVSQRYVEVGPQSLLVPRLPEAEDAIYRRAAARMMSTYRRLMEVLTAPAAKAYFELFPARRKNADRWTGAIKKRAQEIARYVLPVATFTHLYHTVSGLTLHRYHRLCQQLDVPGEATAVVRAMVEAASAHDPLFFRDIEDPVPLGETPEAILMAALRLRAGGAEARAFARQFDESLGGLRSRLVDYKLAAETSVAQAVRSVHGLPRERLSDDEAIFAVLAPEKNPLLAQTLTLTTLSKLSRALVHPHYTFRKKLSHTADSQDQRHRMVPGSRPVLAAQYCGGEPDVVTPGLIALSAEGTDLFREEMRQTFCDVDRLLSGGVDPADALYLLPNAFPIRFEESGDLLHLHRKWTTRLCYTTQEEIWRASLEEVEQLRAVHPRLGAHVMPPCQLRQRAGVRPPCPEGPRYCGVPVWRVALGQFERLL